MDPTRAAPPQRPPLGRLVAGGLAVAALALLVLGRLLLPGDLGYAVWGTTRAGDPLRWDPCAPVRVIVNPQDAPAGAVADLRTAIALLEDASDLDLVLVGTTAERPSADRPLTRPTPGGQDWREVLVAWSTPEATDLPLTALDRGVAVPVAVRDGDREALVTGQVVLNADREDLVPGFGDRGDAWGATLIHELGHVLGLAHVDDPSQLMAAAPGTGPVRLGPGDRAGLAAVGRGAGCVDGPDPAAEAGGRALRTPALPHRDLRRERGARTGQAPVDGEHHPGDPAR